MTLRPFKRPTLARAGRMRGVPILFLPGFCDQFGAHAAPPPFNLSAGMSGRSSMAASVGVSAPCWGRPWQVGECRQGWGTHDGGSTESQPVRCRVGEGPSPHAQDSCRAGAVDVYGQARLCTFPETPPAPHPHPHTAQGQGCRVVACIGDGSFQVTAQDVSTMMRYDQNPIIILINNGGYTIEVEIHDGPKINNYNVIKNWHVCVSGDWAHALPGMHALAVRGLLPPPCGCAEVPVL